MQYYHIYFTYVSQRFRKLGHWTSLELVARLGVLRLCLYLGCCNFSNPILEEVLGGISDCVSPNTAQEWSSQPKSSSVHIAVACDLSVGLD